jgi:hypothetical protein
MVGYLQTSYTGFQWPYEWNLGPWNPWWFPGAEYLLPGYAEGMQAFARGRTVGTVDATQVVPDFSTSGAPGIDVTQGIMSLPAIQIPGGIDVTPSFGGRQVPGFIDATQIISTFATRGASDAGLSVQDLPGGLAGPGVVESIPTPPSWSAAPPVPWSSTNAATPTVPDINLFAPNIDPSTSSMPTSWGDPLDSGDGSSEPIVLDLTGNGINITQETSSTTFFDMSGSGQQSLTAWVGAGNGVLFFDPTGQGQLTQANQIVFTDWDPSAASDMQALLDVFDTNHDGSLDAGDADFSRFFVMETNADGTQTAHSLASLGITSINLNANATNIVLPDGSSIDGETTYTTSSGTTGTAATVTFATDPNGYAVTAATTTNADGSVTIRDVAENPDGSVAYQRVLNTLIATTSNGLTTTKTLSNLNSGSVVATLQTDVTVAVTGGATTETLTNYAGGTVLSTGALTGAGTASAEKLNSTSTTTTHGAGNTVVTIVRDQTGGGVPTQQEVDTTNADGSASYVVSNLNPDGSASDVKTTTVSSDGLTRDVSDLVDGNSAFATTSHDVTVVNVGTRTETTSNSVGTTVTSLVQTVTQTTATTVTCTTASDLTDGTTLDLTTVAQTVTDAATGISTTTQTDTSANGTLLDQTVTTQTPQSDGGLMTVVTTSELDGGTFAEVDSSTTTVSNAGATQTTTVAGDSADGTHRSKSTTTSTVGSAARSVTTYGNGDGQVTHSETVTVNGGTTTDTLDDFNGDGSLVDATVTTTTAGGLSKTIRVDSTGVGTAAAPGFDHIKTDSTASSAGGSVETVTDYGASTSNPIDCTQTAVSADGLDITVSKAFTSASLASPNTWDQITDDRTTVNADGSLKETITVTDGTSNTLQTTEKDTSADRRTVTTTTTLGTTRLVKTVETVTTQGNGTVQDQAVKFDQQGDVIGATVTITSADGLSKTVKQDVQGQSQAAFVASGLAFDSTTTDTTAINADGSRTETTGATSPNGATLSTTSTLTSANGLSVTTTANPYATTHFATQTVDATTLNADGSRTRTVSTSNYDQTLIGRTTTTTSASGLSTTVLADLNGDGTADQSSTDVTTINADGTKTEIVTDYTGGTNGTVRDITTTHSGIIVGGAGLETTITRQSNGSVPTYQVETILPSANGTVTDTTRDYAMANGPLLKTVTVTTSANGLVTTTGTAVNGDATTDFSTIDATALNADGGRTETVSQSNGAGLISETVTTTSANGLSKTTKLDANGATNGSGVIFNLTTTDNTVLNADGGHTETVTEFNGNYATNPNNASIAETVTITSADRQNTTTDRYLGETGNATTVDQRETVQTQADGSVVDTKTTYDAANALLGTIVVTTSGNGLSQSTTYSNAAGAVVDAQNCTTSYDANGAGGQLQDCEDALVVDGTNLSTSVKTQTSGNSQSKTITMVLAGGLSATNVASFGTVATDSVAIADSGVTTETIADTIGGAASDTTTIVTSADKRTVTTSSALAGAASPYIVDTKTTALDGSTSEVTTYCDPANPAIIESQTTVDTSYDGRTVSTATSTDFDGTKYNVVQDTLVGNADGTTTETQIGTGSFGAPAFINTVATATNADASQTTTSLNYDANDVLIGQTVADVSANGLVKSFVFDTTGQESLATLKTAAADLLAGTALPASMLSTDIIEIDTTTLNADGSRTEVVETANGNSFATLRTLTTSTTSANGLTTVTKADNDGNGVFEQVDTRTVAPDGSVTDVVDYYGDTAATANTLTGSNTSTTSADGLVTTLTTSSGITDTTTKFADANGSYQFSQTVAANSTAAAQGFAAGSATHDIDANGIDTWSWQDGSAGGSSGQIKIDVATESQDVAIANQIYMTLLGRTMDGAETQYLAHYISDGVLDRQALAEAIVTDAKGEYATDFYDVLNATLNSATNLSTVPVAVIAAFENSFGRMPTAQELATFGALANATTSPATNIATMAVAIAQYVTDQGSTNHRTLIDPNQGDALSGLSWIDPASSAPAGAIGTIYGSTLGQALGGGNLFTQLANGTAVQLVTYALAPAAGGDSTEASALATIGTISPALEKAFQSEAVGALSSFLAGELAQGLGFNGTTFGDQLLRAVSGSLLSTVLNNIASSIASGQPLNLFANISAGSVATSVATSVSDFIGGYLAHEIVEPENEGGSLGGSLGSMLGTAIGTALSSGGAGILGSIGAQILTDIGLSSMIGTASDLILDILLPGVGAFLGTLLGTFLGNFFSEIGSHPEDFGFSGVVFNPGAHGFQLTQPYGQGDLVGTVSNLATATLTTLDQFLTAIGGQASSDQGIQISYDLSAEQNGYTAFSVVPINTPNDPYGLYDDSYGYWYAYNLNFTGEDMITDTVITALKHVQFTGGNIYMETALANSQATTLAGLAGDLEVGEDYGRYLTSKNVIDDLIALNPNSTFAAGWIVTLLRAQELGLTQLDVPTGPETLIGGLGNDVLVGTQYNDTLGGGAGNNTLQGSGGNDTYVYNRGDGTDTVVDHYEVPEPYTYTSTYDVVVFPEEMVDWDTYWDSDVPLYGITRTVVVSESITYDDSGAETHTGVFVGYQSQVGTATGMQMVHVDGGNDTLSFGPGISASDIEIKQSGNDLIVGVIDPTHPTATFADLTSEITLQNWMDPLDRIENIRFADGTTLDVAAIESRIGAAASDMLKVQAATGSAGQPIGLSIALTPLFTQETLSPVRITGVPSVAMLSAGTRNGDGSWTLTQAQLAGLTLTVPAGGFAGTATLTVSVTATESDGSQSSSSATLAVAIAGVAATPTLALQNASGFAGTWIPLSISTALTASDGTESLVVTIVGVPSGARLSAGTQNSDGSWTLTPAQLVNLVLIAPPPGSFAGTVNLGITSTATETDGSTASATANLAVGIATPTITVIEANGATQLTQVGNEYLLYGSSGTAPVLQIDGLPVTAGMYGGGWAPIAAEPTPSGYEVAWKGGNNLYADWIVDSGGSYVSSVLSNTAGTSFALEALEPSFHQDLNGDGLIGPPGLIQVDGSTYLTQVGSNYYLYNSSGTGPVLQFGGAPVTAGQVNGWAPIGAVQTPNGLTAYEVALRLTGTNQYSVWGTDSSGNFDWGILSSGPGTSLLLEGLELIFQQDLNGDGTIGPPGVTQIGNMFYLSNGSGPGVMLRYQGAPVTAGAYGGNWTLIAAVQTASGYDVVWSNVGGDQYGVWQVDSNGNYVANILTSVSGTNFGLEALETSFHLDLNGDGVIGLSNVIQVDGSTYLTQVGSNYYLYNSSGTGPVLQFGGAPVIAGQINGWPIGAVQTANGYDVALRLTGTNQYSVWGTDSSGNFSSGIIGGVAGTSLALEGLELTFQQDLNGDGTVGPPGVTDVGNQIYLSLGSAPGLALKYLGAPVVVGQFGSNWTRSRQRGRRAAMTSC